MLDSLVVQVLNEAGAYDPDSAISLQEIADRLRGKGVNVDSLELLQINTLTPLKKQGKISSLVYPGPRRGGYFLTNRSYSKLVVRQILQRVVSELETASGQAQHCGKKSNS